MTLQTRSSSTESVSINKGLLPTLLFLQKEIKSNGFDILRAGPDSVEDLNYFFEKEYENYPYPVTAEKLSDPNNIYFLILSVLARYQ